MSAARDPVAERLYRLMPRLPILREVVRDLVRDLIREAVVRDRKAIAKALGNPRHHKAAVEQYRRLHAHPVFGKVVETGVPVMGAWAEYILEGGHDDG